MSIELSDVDRKINFLKKTLPKFKRGTDIDGVESETLIPAAYEIGLLTGQKYLEKDFDTYWAAIQILQRDLPSEPDPKRLAMDVWNSKKVMGTAPVARGISWLHARLPMLADDERITSRPPVTRNATLKWYRQKMPEVTDIDHKLHMYRGKSQDVNHLFKVAEVGRLGIELFTEDSFEHAEAISDHTKATTLLVPRSWNKGYAPGPGKRIIVVPETKYPFYPSIVRAYLHLADVLA